MEDLFCLFALFLCLLIFFLAFAHLYSLRWASQVTLVVKNMPANAGDIRDSVWEGVQDGVRHSVLQGIWWDRTFR